MYYNKYLSVLFLSTTINNIAYSMEGIDVNLMPAAEPAQKKEEHNQINHNNIENKNKLNYVYDKEYNTYSIDKQQESNMKQFNDSLDKLNTNIMKIYDTYKYHDDNPNDILNNILSFVNYSNTNINQYNNTCENFNKYLISVSDNLNEFNINNIPLKKKINALINNNSDNIDQIQKYKLSKQKYLNDNINTIINSVNTIKNAIKDIKQHYNYEEVYKSDKKIRNNIDLIHNEITKIHNDKQLFKDINK